VTRAGDTFPVVFDLALRNALLELDDVLDLGAISDDLQGDVAAGKLTLDEAWAIMQARGGIRGGVS
jgi:hypothetical protein